MSRRGENIYKRKDGRWEGRYIKGHIDGKIKYGYVFAKTYKEVKDKLTNAKNMKETDSVYILEERDEIISDTFSTVANEWFEIQKVQLKRASIVKYYNIINNYLFPNFADRIVSEISRDDIIRFSSSLLVDGGADRKGLSPKTVNDIISVLKRIFEYATQIKEYAVSDIKGISIRQPQSNMRILSFSEQQRLSNHLLNNLNSCNLGILLCLYTGLRIGEICALKWGDIYFKDNYLYVHQTMQRLQTMDEEKSKTSIVISTPKSKCSIRKIPIPNNLLCILQKMQKENKAYILTGMINNYMEPRTMQNRFKSVIKSCNLDDANFHSLRHTFATRCIELKFDIKSLSEILGHASVNITLNKYIHPSMELKQKNMNMLSELFSVK